jgi:hypothetical protein
MTHCFRSAGRTAGLCLGVVLLSGVCLGQPALTLSGPGGTPTTGVSVSVSGYPPSTAVDIYFDTANVALAVTNSTGSFSGIKIQVPATALPGRNWVTGVARVSGDAAQAPFKVQTNWTEFHYASSHSGFNPYENVLSPATAGNLALSWSYPISVPLGPRRQ